VTFYRVLKGSAAVFDLVLTRMGVPATRTHRPESTVIELWCDAHAVRFVFLPDGGYVTLEITCPEREKDDPDQLLT
jgi:hypothetical protein